MSDQSPIPSSSEAIDDAATTWVLRHDRGLTPTEQDDFLQWLAADPRHGAAYARQRKNWDRLDLLGQWRPEHSPRANRDLLAPTAEDSSRARVLDFPRRWMIGIGLAAAAALAIGLFVTRPQSEPVRPSLAAPVTIATIEKRALEDGSLVELNRGAEVTVDYSATERRVQLVRGEAHFTVAKNPDRPFIVRAAGVDVRAVGTAFNVRLGEQAVEVLVTEGQVAVAMPESVARKSGDAVPHAAEGVAGGFSSSAVLPFSPLLVTVGERAVVPLAARAQSPVVAAVASADMERELAWQPRLLDFSSAPLREIVAEFNARNAPYELTVADPRLAELQISATLRSDNIEGFLRLLEAGFGARIERNGQQITLRSR